MDKVTLLTASRLEPTVAIRPHSTVVARLGRTLAIPLQLHHRFKHISSFICLQTYFISSALLISTRYAFFYAFLASAFILKHAFAMSSKAIVDAWDSKSIQKVRARIFYEFAVFILGCGNAIFLIVFWPGWLLIGGALFALWQLAG